LLLSRRVACLRIVESQVFIHGYKVTRSQPRAAEAAATPGNDDQRLAQASRRHAAGQRPVERDRISHRHKSLFGQGGELTFISSQAGGTLGDNSGCLARRNRESTQQSY